MEPDVVHLYRALSKLATLGGLRRYLDNLTSTRRVMIATLDFLDAVSIQLDYAQGVVLEEIRERAAIDAAIARRACSCSACRITEYPHL